MQFKFEGDYGNIIFSGNDSSRFMSIPVATAITFFKSLALYYPEIAANELGLFTLASLGRNREAKFASLSVPKHVLQKRVPGCTWRSKGRITSDISRIDMCPIEYMGDECPDIFWGDCLESLFGVGNGVHDLYGTPEISTMMTELLNRIFIGLGNSFFELAWWGQHPLIDLADENQWYKVGKKEWNDYTDQQDACGGWMTYIDALKNDDNLSNFMVDIHSTDVKGATYIGDAFDLVDRLTATASGDFSAMLDAGATLDGREPIILVTPGIFNRLEEQLMIKFSQLPEMMYYFINKEANINGKRILRNVLRYKGYNIVKVNAWSMFDSITGTTTHRAILTVPGNFGMAYDIPELNQFQGMGLKVTQHLEDPYKGKVFMSTTFKEGTAILNTGMMTHASLTLLPPTA